jgi:hypothetical protein
MVYQPGENVEGTVEESLVAADAEDTRSSESEEEKHLAKILRVVLERMWE